MTVEAVTHISDLNPLLPTGSDSKAEGDDHVRNIKKAIKASFPNISGAMTLTHTVLNGLPTDIAAKGAITGQTWAGTHNFPATTYGVTAAPGSTGTRYATLDYVNAQAFSSALPAQTGNAGKVLGTNGTTAKWISTIPTIHVYTDSATWVADVPRIRLIVQGASGSTAAAPTNPYSGGAAGGTAIKTLDVTVGASYTITVGAGGAAVSIAPGGTATAGQSGGTSSFSGPDITTVSATGGGGGMPFSDSLPGGVGVGGDLNLRGGVSHLPRVNDGRAPGGDSYLGKGAPYGQAVDAYSYGAGPGGGFGSDGMTGSAGSKGVVIIEKLVIGV